MPPGGLVHLADATHANIALCHTNRWWNGNVS